MKCLSFDNFIDSVINVSVHISLLLFPLFVDCQVNETCILFTKLGCEWGFQLSELNTKLFITLALIRVFWKSPLWKFYWLYQNEMLQGCIPIPVLVNVCKLMNSFQGFRPTVVICQKRKWSFVLNMMYAYDPFDAYTYEQWTIYWTNNSQSDTQVQYKTLTCVHTTTTTWLQFQ